MAKDAHVTTVQKPVIRTAAKTDPASPASDHAKQPDALAPKLIADDESGKRTFELVNEEKRLVSTSYVVTIGKDKDKKRYQVHSSLDFSGVTIEEILELATSSVVIRLQNERRALSIAEATKPDLHRNVDVRLELDRGRKPRDERESAIRSFAKLAGVSLEAAEQALLQLEASKAK